MSGPTVKFKVDLRPRQARTVVAPPLPSRAATSSPATEAAAPTAPVSTAARTLALAHFIEREVRAGRWKSYREAAIALGVCHARVQHIIGLLLLSADTQASILTGAATPTERAMRELAERVQWT
jgi:hypothetical protein